MISAADDRPHEHGGQPGWEERLTFDVHDAAHDYVVKVAMTHTPGDRRAAAALVLTLPGGETAQSLHRAQNAKRADLTVGRLTIGIDEPLKRWTIACKDVALVLPSGELRGIAAPIDLALTLDAIGEPDGTTDRRTNISDQRFMSIVSRGHVTQSIKATGKLKVGTNEIIFEGVGTRERRWGVPDATEPPS